MGMVVRTNIMAMNANRSLGVNNSQVGKSLEKLSSGFKINRAADDASGLAISEKMKAQIKGLETASSNAQDGISLIQTAEGATSEIHNMLNRMVELATKASNGTIADDVDREAIQREVNDLNTEISRITDSTNFNGINLINGDLGGTKKSAIITSAAVAAVAATSATVAATAEFTFEDVESIDDIIGKSITVGDKTYEFVKDGEDAAKGNVAINLAATDITAELLGTEFKTAYASTPPTDYAIIAAADAGKVTISGSKTVADGNFEGRQLDVSFSDAGLQLQVGDTSDLYNQVNIQVDDLSAAGLKTEGLDVSTQKAAGKAIQVIKDAINKVSTNRANLGSLQNRLDHSISNLDTTAENMTAANSRIRDTDMAKEMMVYTKNNILTQAAQSMLAQANQQPQAILQLLG